MLGCLLVVAAPLAEGHLPRGSAVTQTETVCIDAAAVPLHHVDGGFISFALDQPWIVEFPPAASGRTVDFSSPVLRAVVALVGKNATASGEGGFIRLGGTCASYCCDQRH